MNQCKINRESREVLTFSTVQRNSAATTWRPQKFRKCDEKMCACKFHFEDIDAVPNSDIRKTVSSLSKGCTEREGSTSRVGCSTLSRIEPRELSPNVFHSFASGRLQLSTVAAPNLTQLYIRKIKLAVIEGRLAKWYGARLRI